MSETPAPVRLGLRGPNTPRHWQVREGRLEYLQAVRFRELVEAERRGEILIANQAAELEAAIERGALLPLPNLVERMPDSDNEDGRRVWRAVNRPMLKDLRDNEAALSARGDVETWAHEHRLGDEWTVDTIEYTLALWRTSPRSRQQLIWSSRFNRQLARAPEVPEPPRPQDFANKKAYLAAAEAAYKRLEERQAEAGWTRTATKDARVFEWLAERKAFGLTLADIALARGTGLELDSYRKGIERIARLIGVTL